MRTRIVTEDPYTVLGVWAHPDDKEAYLSAGITGALRDAGDHVVVATATYGENRTADPNRWLPAELVAVRPDELRSSLALIGVEEHHSLGFTDGDCADLPPRDEEISVAKLISDVEPDTILTFGPEGTTRHPNDRVGLWMSGGGLVMPHDEPAPHVPLTGAALDRKVAALRAQVSQTAGPVDELGEEDLGQRWFTEAFLAAPAALSESKAWRFAADDSVRGPR